MVSKPRAGRWLVILLAFGLTACSGLPVDVGGRSDTLPRQVELTEVPFHPQEAYQCGPAALATLLEYAGIKRSPAALTNEVYLPERQGSLQPELLAATRRAGLLPYVLEPKWEAVLSELAAGYPVLVLQDIGLPLLPQWHYAVVVGYERGEQRIILRSGTEPRQTMSFAQFDRRWQKSGRWAFVAMPPDRLPASAEESRYVAAAVALEKVAPEAAGRAYGLALDHWPGNLSARLGFGNVAYRRHDMAVAENAYRRATADYPEAAAAWNNLAMALHHSGRRAEALAAVRRAIEIGGPWQDYYTATEATIEKGITP